MSNTAEYLTKHFREVTGQTNLNDLEGNDIWPWKRFKEELFNFFVTRSSSDEVSELFPKYRTRLQNNFFVSLLMLNILFNVIVIVVALLEKVMDSP